jgi:hypothetical protein
MKRLIIIIFICIAGTAFSQYPNPLSSSGSLSINDITEWMKAAGEITSTAPASLSSLNSASHLINHTQPFSIYDWYGYSKTSVTPPTSVNNTVYFYIYNGRGDFFEGLRNEGYKADMGCVKIFDLQTNTQINIKDSGNGVIADHKNNPPTSDGSSFQMTNRTGQLAITFHDYGIQTDPPPSNYEFGVYMVNAGDVGMYSTLIPGGNALFIVNKSDIINNGNQLYIKIQKR